MISFEALKKLLTKILQVEGVKVDLQGSDIAKDSTLQAIKAQTDRLAFDSEGNLKVGQGSRAAGTITVASAADISSGVTANLPPAGRWTLFLHADGAVDVDIYLSPDGTNWFKVPEGPVSFTAAGDEVIEFGYVAKAIKLVGSNTTTVTAIIYYVV